MRTHRKMMELTADEILEIKSISRRKTGNDILKRLNITTATFSRVRTRQYAPKPNKPVDIAGLVTKDVVGYEGCYTVREDGYIFSKKRFACRGGIVKQTINKLGYLVVYLCKGHKAKTVKVHRILAIAFIPNPENKPQVNHKNGIKTDNSLSNLEWATAKENVKHAHETGLTYHKRGHESLTTKLNETQRIEIAKSYSMDNVNQTELAKIYNVSQSLISLCIKDFIRNTFNSGHTAIEQTKLNIQ